jgi:CheY-like chemotaxis protein
MNIDLVIQILFIILVIATVAFVFFGVKYIILDEDSGSVLVMDDNERMLKSLAELLAYRKIPVHLASSINRAKFLFEKHKDITHATIDLEMPTESKNYIRNGISWGGIEIFELLQSQYKDIEPIVLSAHSLDEIREAGFVEQAEKMERFFVAKNDPKYNYIKIINAKL